MLALGAGDDTHRRLLAAYQIEAGDFPGAEKTLAYLRTRFPNDPELFRDQVRLLLETGRYAEAEPMLRQTLESDPDAVWALSALARLRYQEKRYHEALPLLERAAALEPGDSATQQLLAKVIELSGDKTRALALYEGRLTRGDVNADSLNRYVNLAHAQGETARAVAVLQSLRQSARRAPARQAVVAALARLYEREGRVADAVALFREQTRRGEAEPQLLLELARLEFASGDVAAGMADLQRLGYNTIEPGLLLAAARLAARHGDTDLATELFGRAYYADRDAPLAGVLYLENLLLRGSEEEAPDLLFALHDKVTDPDQRELLTWMALFHYARTGQAEHYDGLLPFALRTVAKRAATRVDLTRWAPVLDTRLAEPRRAQMIDLLAVFGRTLAPAAFAKKHNLVVEGL